MGARPRGAVVAVTAPPGTDLEELHRGMADASIVTGCPIVGGDLARGRDVTVASRSSVSVPDAARSCEAAPGWEMNCSSRPLGVRRRVFADAGPGLALGRIGGRASASLAPPRRRHGRSRVRRARDDGPQRRTRLDLHRFADASGVGFELSDVPVADGATSEEAISGERTTSC